MVRSSQKNPLLNGCPEYLNMTTGTATTNKQAMSIDTRSRSLDLGFIAKPLHCQSGGRVNATYWIGSNPCSDHLVAFNLYVVVHLLSSSVLAVGHYKTQLICSEDRKLLSHKQKPHDDHKSHDSKQNVCKQTKY